MTDTASSPAVPPFKDTSTSLVVFGVLEIILGAVCALMVPLIVVGQMMAPDAGALPMGQMAAGMGIYLLFGAFFVTIGYGSIRARRWARAIMLVISWIWLVVGLISIVAVWFVLPDVYQAAAKQQGQRITPEAIAFMKFFSLVFLSTIYVILPGVFVLYYRSRNVQATCEWKNPSPVWTDRCPLPVLGLSLMAGYGAVACLITIVAYNSVVPMFGIFLSGIPGAAVIVLSSLLLGYLGWGLYRLKPAAWWGMAGLGLFYLLSSVVTFMQTDLFEFYRRMGMRESELELIRDLDIMNTGVLTGFTIAWSVVYFGYMLFIKKYFGK